MGAGWQKRERREERESQRRRDESERLSDRFEQILEI